MKTLKGKVHSAPILSIKSKTFGVQFINVCVVLTNTESFVKRLTLTVTHFYMLQFDEKIIVLFQNTSLLVYKVHTSKT